MSPPLQIALLWTAFAVSHIVLSSLPVRGRLLASLGENAFRALYSIIALAIFVPLVWIYFANKHAGPALWNLQVGDALYWLIYVGMGVAFILLVSAFIQPSPAGMAGAGPTPRGVLFITRHPLLMAFALFGLLHLIPNGFAADVVFFGGFVAFVLVGAWHQDQRKLETQPGYAAFHAATPFLPFTGRETMRGLREMSPVAVALGVALTVVVRTFHARWFGG
jgi:uncharacterized membrane protein